MRSKLLIFLCVFVITMDAQELTEYFYKTAEVITKNKSFKKKLNKCLGAGSLYLEDTLNTSYGSTVFTNEISHADTNILNALNNYINLEKEISNSLESKQRSIIHSSKFKQYFSQTGKIHVTYSYFYENLIKIEFRRYRGKKDPWETSQEFSALFYFKKDGELTYYTTCLTMH